jgi:hypothetical protein
MMPRSTIENLQPASMTRDIKLYHLQQKNQNSSQTVSYLLFLAIPLANLAIYLSIMNIRFAMLAVSLACFTISLAT